MKWTAKQIAYAAICLAIATVLGFITLFTMPQGGSVTPGSFLPVMIFAYVFGPKKGFIVSLIYSLLVFLQTPYFFTPVQFLLDYILAFTSFGVAGFFKNNILPGIILGGALMFVCQFLSGILFYSEYAPAGQPVWLYSLIYNGSTATVNIAICIVIAIIPPMHKFIHKLKLRADNGEI